MGQTVFSAAYQFLNQQMSLKDISVRSKAGLWDQRRVQVGKEGHKSLSQTSGFKQGQTKGLTEEYIHSFKVAL